MYEIVGQHPGVDVLGKHGEETGFLKHDKTVTLLGKKIHRTVFKTNELVVTMVRKTSETQELVSKTRLKFRCSSSFQLKSKFQTCGI